MKRIAFAITTAALLASPLAAHAQSTQSSSVNLSGEALKACVLGQPAVADLDLGDLTGDDGRIDSRLVGPAVAAATEIEIAWCNAPSVMTIDASPLSLVSPPAYATPANFSRLITYTAAVTGWADALSDRPKEGDNAKSAPATAAHAADPLGIEISDLATLDAGGTVEGDAFLEAGTYSGVIVVGLTVAN